MTGSEFWWTVDRNDRLYLSWRYSDGKIRTFFLGNISPDLLNLHITTIAKIIRAEEGQCEFLFTDNLKLFGGFFLNFGSPYSVIKLSGKKNSWQIDLNIRGYKDAISGLSDFSIDKLSVVGNVLQ